MDYLDLALADVLAGAHGSLAADYEGGYQTMKKIHDGAAAEVANLRAVKAAAIALVTADCITGELFTALENALGVKP